MKIGYGFSIDEKGTGGRKDQVSAVTDEKRNPFCNFVMYKNLVYPTKSVAVLDNKLPEKQMLSPIDCPFRRKQLCGEGSKERAAFFFGLLPLAGECENDLGGFRNCNTGKCKLQQQ